MGHNAVVRDGPSQESNGLQTGPDRPLKKKRSLTRLFSASRSSSRSRAPSPEDSPIPTTPTIPEHFLPPSRKASASEIPSISTSASKHSAPSVLTDVTNVAAALREHSDARNQDLKGILKPQTSSPKLRSSAPEREAPNGPNNRALTRPETPTSIQKRRRGKSTTYRSPTFPSTTESRVHVESSTSPSTRDRGASTTSFGLPRFQGSRLDADIPPRPSTSGAEQRGRIKRDNCGENELNRGLGLSFGPISEPNLPDTAEVRASFRSAMTASSSIIETSTARSSIVTKDTSASDLTIDGSSKDGREDGMTVDEAIGMYENGFTDDIDSEHDDLSSSSISEEEKRRSMRIAEAINDTMGSTTRSPVQSSTAAAFAATTVQPSVLRCGQPRTPSIMSTTTARDQYGFLKVSRYITIAQYDTWNSMYASDQLRRTKKWFTYMREQGCTTHLPEQFPDRSPKTLRYIRKGIPPAWRGAAWFCYSGARKLFEENPNVYPSLSSRTSELSSDDADAIERDLHRTFPDNVHFKPDQPTLQGRETPLLSSLRRVLQAFAIHHPQIGYCQSLNFLAGLLLLFLPEEKTFWMLHIITSEYLPGTHEISLEGANVDLWVLMLALKESSPGIWAKVGVGDEDVGSIHTARLPPISLCTTSWFMSMFIGTLPIETVLRVWDIVFYEGSKTLFRIALAIFKMGEQRIRDVHDPVELFQVVQAFPRSILETGTLIGLACRRGGISQEWITKKRKERRKWYGKEKGRVGGGAVTPVDMGDDPALIRANSAWRRRVGLVR
ncbi:MAG: hypothetical protein Q9219_005998 [cf. Caloplaca sp. 3 TL-2023]